MTDYSICIMNAKELYIELQNPRYETYPFSRSKDWGEEMEIVSEVISGYWRMRFLVNHLLKEAFVLMQRDLTLPFISQEDVDWVDVESLDNNSKAYAFSAYYQRFSVGTFRNGVACVEWTLYPDGRYFMDEDGFGMEDNDESVLYGFIDKKARVVVPFQAKDWKEMDALRPEAEMKAFELEHKDREVFTENA